MEKLLRQVPLAIVAILVAAGLWYGPITQPAGYHTFADQSAYYDIPHFADVVSNRLCSRNLWLSMISDGQGQPLSGFQSSS